jgi:uncharacterized protein (UPF0332 family)
MTSEQAGLLRKAHRSFGAAKVLFDHQYYDFALARAYYAMFYVASAFLLGEGMTFSKHSAVIAAFGQHFAKTGLVPAEFHRFLLDAEDERKAGNYRIESVTEAQTAEQIDRAAKFLALAEDKIGKLP